MKKTTLHFVIVWLVLLTIISSFTYYIYQNIDKYAELVRLSTGGIVLIFLIAFSFPLINAVQNILVYRELGANISYWESVMITAASTLVNQLPLPGGVISKGYYLKKRFSLSYASFTSSTIALFLCFTSVSGFIGLAILLYGFLSKNADMPLALLVGYVVMSLSFTLFWMPLNKSGLPNFFRFRLKQALEGWKVLSSNFFLLVKLISLQTILMLLLAFRYWFAFQMLSQDVTISQVLLFSTVSVLSQLVLIAPGGLGVQELIVGTVAGVLGFDISVGVLAVGLDRLISTLVIFLQGWVSIALLGKQFTKNNREVNKADSSYTL